jgi:S1-C subfamily serine protease
MALLTEIQENIQRVTGSVGSAVVGIGQRWGVGSGVVVASGLVLTNAHNLRSEPIVVTFADGRAADGQVRGLDIDGDLAVVEVDSGGSEAIEWVAEAAPAIGTPVFALSNPGGRGLRVTLGFITGVERSFRGPRGRHITGTIEHDAPLLPGSSGGPVVTPEGQLLGINTNRLGEGFYLAIPADADTRTRVDALSRGESAAQPRIGIGVAPRHVARRLRRAVGLPDRDGLLIREVEDDSPASRAGLAAGDLIVAAAGRPVSAVDDLFEALDSAREGGVELTVLRGADERVVVVHTSQASDA